MAPPHPYNGLGMQKRYFTVEEANTLLPWVRQALDRAGEVYERLSQLNEELYALNFQARRDGRTSVERRLNRLRQQIGQAQTQLEGIIAEMGRKGIIVRDVEEGVVDFPSLREGREVYLCWRRGEERVLYWHETDTGFAGRRPL